MTITHSLEVKGSYFVGIRDFIVFKFKRMVVFNGVRDFTKMRFLSIELEKCENIKDLEKLCHTIYNQGTKHILMIIFAGAGA